VSFKARFEHADERRDDGRRTLQLDATGTFAGGTDAVTVHNISATGLLIETETSMAQGEAFVVELPEAGAQLAEVVWADAPMFGCRFAEPLGAAALSAAQLRSVPGGAPATTDDDFGARLHRLRRERGLSLGDIAARLGVSKPTVWAWEHGKSRPVERRLASLADVLGVTPGGLEPAPAGPNAELEQSRRKIAAAYGIEPSRVRIMIEL
jgi:transcriptional regulator with XRE-family HTH domain